MGNGPNVITILDRFTFSSAGGAAAMYSLWVSVPTWCRTTEVIFECFGFNSGGPVDMTLESSMDKVDAVGLATEGLSGPTVKQATLSEGLGRYARVKLSPRGSTVINMVLSAHLLLRTAE